MKMLPLQKRKNILSLVIVSMLVGLVKSYQRLVRPLFPPACRHEPSCSQYAIEALEQYGAIKGLGLAFKRILRCHPWGSGGYDPVPTLPENVLREKCRNPDSLCRDTQK